MARRIWEEKFGLACRVASRGGGGKGRGLWYACCLALDIFTDVVLRDTLSERVGMLLASMLRRGCEIHIYIHGDPSHDVVTVPSVGFNAPLTEAIGPAQPPRTRCKEQSFEDARAMTASAL